MTGHRFLRLLALTFLVAACSDSHKPGSDGGPQHQVTVPGAPTSVIAKTLLHSALVSWTAPVSDGGAAIEGYVVMPYVGTTAGTPVDADAGVTQATVSGLTNGTTVTFHVVARNAVGDGPPGVSNAITLPDVPGAPTDVMVTASGSTSVDVSWTAPSNDGGSAITGYVVSADPGGLSAPSTTDTHANLTGLVIGTTYTITVQAANALGNGPASSSVMYTPTSVPSAPLMVTAMPGNSQATVSWTQPASEGGGQITKYVVTSHAPDGSTSATTTTDTSVVMTGLTNGTPYTFTVHAKNQFGDGAESAASSPVTPATTPGAPTSVTASPRVLGAEVSWTAPADDGGGAIMHYTIVVNGGDSQVDTTGPATSFFVPNLTPGTSYSFKVFAINWAGDGPASDASAPVVPLSALSPTASTMTATPSTQPADGRSAVKITVSLQDMTGDFPEGEAVTLSAAPSGPTFMPASGPTGADGTFTSMMVAKNPGNFMVTATVDGLTLQAPASFTLAACSSLPSFSVQDGPLLPTDLTGLAVGDLNGSGQKDLIALAGIGVEVMLGMGSGTFGMPIGFEFSGIGYTAGNSHWVAVADFDGDHIPDIVATDDETPSSFVDVWPGRGDGSFKAAANFDASGNTPGSADVADFDRDGNLDIVVANGGTGTASAVSVLFGLGDGTFKAPVKLHAGNSPNNVVAGDFDGKNGPDLAVSNTDDNSISIFLNDGTGKFQLSTTLTGVADAGVFSLVARDLDGNGTMDLAVASSTQAQGGGVAVLLGNGDGTFAPSVFYPTGAGPSALVVDDFDSDGHPDIAVAHAQGGVVSVLRGLGNGTFAPHVDTIVPGASLLGLVSGDFNGDGRPDLAAGPTSDSKVSILTNVCTP